MFIAESVVAWRHPNVCDPRPTSRDCRRQHQAVAVGAPGVQGEQKTDLL